MVTGIPNDQTQRGFSLLELIVTLALASIITAGATMQFGAIRESLERQSGLNQLEFDIRKSRAESVSKGVRGIFTIDPSARVYRFGIDALPYSDTAGGDSQVFQRELPQNVTLQGQTLVFDSRGFLIDPVSGSPNTATLALAHKGEPFCELSVSTVGTVTPTCP